MNRLPTGAVFVDVYNSFPSLSTADRDAMLVRALIAVAAQNARLHIKSSPFAHRLMDSYCAVLSSQFKSVYYRFSDGTATWRGIPFRSHWNISFFRRQLDNIELLICDCENIVKNDKAFFLGGGGKYHTIYAKCTSSHCLETDRAVKHRLLWASRVSVEKRPELIRRIATALRQVFPKIIMDVYGHIDACYDPKFLFGVPGVCYHGGFDEFDSLPIANFDAFIYTSSFDGMPNIVLEAMACGLPVVAPNVGGIGEAVVSGETGHLVSNMADDDTLIDAYVDAVCDLYNNWNRSLAMAENGRRLIAEKHSDTVFKQRVIEVFQLDEHGIEGTL